MEDDAGEGMFFPVLLRRGAHYLERSPKRSHDSDQGLCWMRACWTCRHLVGHVLRTRWKESKGGEGTWRPVSRSASSYTTSRQRVSESQRGCTCGPCNERRRRALHYMQYGFF